MSTGSLRILADENMRGVRELFAPLGEVRTLPGRSITVADLAAVDILLVRSVTAVNEALLGDSPVRFVGTATSGFDHIDRDYLRRRNIAFAHAPGANANSVVEYVLSAICRCDDQLQRLLQGGRVGILGYGVIGRALAARLAALGIDYRWNDPWLEKESGAASLEEVLACQVVTLHAELTERQPWPSRHLLDEARLALLSGGQLLINASRGAVIDNAALLRRLQSAAAPQVTLDVWENEPYFDVELLPWLRYATAHIAGYSLDGKLRATRMLRESAVAQLALPIEPLADDDGGAVLELPGGGSDADVLRRAVLARYDITADDRLFRDMVQAGGDRAAGFDRLRRDYAERRELAGSRVQGEFNHEEQSLLEALGCCT